ASDRLRRVRPGDDDPAARALCVHRRRAAHGQAHRRRDAGSPLRGGDPARGVPATRPDADPLPRRRRGRARRPAERRLLREPRSEGEPSPRLGRGGAGPDRTDTVLEVSGQYLAYTFFRVVPAWRQLPVEERTAAKESFADVVDEFAPRFD